MSKRLDEKAAEALRQLGHTEEEIAELAQKAKALPDEENVAEKEDATGAQDAPTGTEAVPAERKTFWAELGEKLGFTKAAPVASEPEEARKADEVTDPASTAEPAEKAEGGEPSETDAETTVRAFGEAMAKSIGEMVRVELDKRDERIATLEETLKGLTESVEEKVNQRLADLPPVVTVPPSAVAATAVQADAPKGITVGNPPQETSKFYQALLGDIERVVKDKVAQFQV